jgi:hypothetical protein
MYHHSQTSRAKPLSPSELRHIGGEDVHVRCRLHILDPCHRRYMARRWRRKDIRRGDVTPTEPESGGGSPVIQWRREEAPLTALHGEPAATDHHGTWCVRRYEYLYYYSVVSFYAFTLVSEILLFKVEYFAYCQDPHIETPI